jgi:putative phosphoribosyl transferase
MAHRLPTHQNVVIGEHGLQGFLDVPQRATGLVIFAHGSGSGRHSPRNQYVAAGLRRAGIATLLIDLLTPQEESDRRNVFDVRLLAGRLREAAAWAGGVEELSALPLGYFGASTGAAAAIIAASMQGDRAIAIVSRGGRPDLAGADALSRVRAPTLLIVGSLDCDVLGLNRNARSCMVAPTELMIVPGAGHLFEEAGTLDQVIGHAERWFTSHFSKETIR